MAMKRMKSDKIIVEISPDGLKPHFTTNDETIRRFLTPVTLLDVQEAAKMLMQASQPPFSFVGPLKLSRFARLKARRKMWK